MKKFKLNTKHINSFLDYTLKVHELFLEKDRDRKNEQRKTDRQKEKQRLTGRYRKKGIEKVREGESKESERDRERKQREKIEGDR